MADQKVTEDPFCMQESKIDNANQETKTIGGKNFFLCINLGFFDNCSSKL